MRSVGGYQFEKEIADTLKKGDLWFYKFVDTHTFEFLAKERKISLPKVPADFLIISNGKAIFLECKSSKHQYSFNLNYIREYQMEFAEQIHRHLGFYFFLICNRSKRKHHEVYILDPIGLKILKKDHSSISWKKLKEKVQVLKKEKGVYYELLEFIYLL